MGQPVPDTQSAGYTRRCTLNGNLDESSILSTSTRNGFQGALKAVFLYNPTQVNHARRDGGIGRHKRLKIARSNPYGFKSRSRHQQTDFFDSRLSHLSGEFLVYSALLLSSSTRY